MNVNLSSIIKPLRGLWDDLVERRLWPVAIVLLVGLVAIPVVLSKSSKSAPPAPAAPGTAPNSPSVAFQAAVTTDGKKSSEIRKNLRFFKQKNPFTPQGLNTGGGNTGATGAAGTATVAGSGTGTTGTSSPATGPSPAGSSTGSSGSTGSGATTVSPGTTTKTFYYHYTVDVKFGKIGKQARKTLTEFRALPGSDNPVLVFMGVKSDGKTAVFLVSAKAATVGEGKCSPSDTECTFLYMKKGDKRRIEAVDTTGAITNYTLSLKSVDVKRTTAPQKANANSSKSRRKAARHASRAKLTRVENSFRSLGL